MLAKPTITMTAEKLNRYLQLFKEGAQPGETVLLHAVHCEELAKLFQTLVVLKKQHRTSPPWKE